MNPIQTTLIEPDTRIQLPAHWADALGLNGLVVLERTAEGILARPCRPKTWEEIFATKPVIGDPVTEPEDVEVTRDDPFSSPKLERRPVVRGPIDQNELSMSTVRAPAEQRFILPGVSWRTYERLLRAFADRPGVRLTYDRGVLELMTLSHEHESQSYILARLVDALTEELGLPVKGGRSTTFRRRKRRRGLEPDASWWIASEPLVRGKTEIDLRHDPPPDLALEIDVTHSSLDRLAIYANLGVPEVWRLEGLTLVCHLLGGGKNYAVGSVSRAFPGLVVADVANFLRLRGQLDDNGIVRQFRAWARQRFAVGGSVQPAP